jgi:hypothetical protein
MNLKLHAQKIQASAANYQKDKIEITSKKISKTVNVRNYLTNEVDRMVTDTSLTMVSLDTITMSLINLVTDVNTFKFALFALRGGTLSYDLVDPSNLKSMLYERKTQLTIFYILSKKKHETT